jgi:hypothetical protein
VPEEGGLPTARHAAHDAAAPEAEERNPRG